MFRKDERYTFAYSTGAAKMTREDWYLIAPLLVSKQQWVTLEHPPEVRVRGVYDDEAMYIHFQVFEEEPVIRHLQHGDPVYEDSCVEFFLQPFPAHDDRYFNFELNAAGVLLLEIGGSGRHRERNKLSEADLFDIHATAGLFNESSGRKYWELNYRIPFSFVQSWFPEFVAAPEHIMKGNFYKCGDRTPNPHYISWQPIDSELPDFHRSDSFGTLMLKPLCTSD